MSYAGLKFTAEQANSTVAYHNNGTNARDVQYSTDDGETWNALAADTNVTLASIGDEVCFKGDNASGWSTSTSNYTNFVMTGSIAASGDIMSLLDNGACSTVIIPCAYCFYKLFYNVISLVKYDGCLTATSLTTGCYYGFFEGCTNLERIPSISANTLNSTATSRMFANCLNLRGHISIFKNKYLSNYCFNGIFSNSGIDSIDLRGINFVSAVPVFEGSFRDCRNLKRIYSDFVKWPIATTTQTLSTLNWLNNASQTGEFICPVTLDNSTRDASHVPEGWTVKRVISSEYCDKITLNNKQVTKITGNRLPAEYQEVEYLESTGEQYIDIGINADSEMGIKAKYAWSDISLSTGTMSFGALGAGGEGYRHHAILNFISQKMYYQFVTGSNGFINIDANAHEYFIDTVSHKCYLDNVFNSNLKEKSFDTQCNYYLFARNYANADIQYAKVKIYFCTIYNQDMPVREFIPCYRKSDSKPGLYDVVNHVFYINQGTGADFSVGGNVTTPQVFWRKAGFFVEGVSLTDIVYLQTHYNPNENINFEHNAQIQLTTSVVPSTITISDNNLTVSKDITEFATSGGVTTFNLNADLFDNLKNNQPYRITVI